MADRTWNRIQPRLYDEWQLSKHARLILAHIITLSPNQYGIYDPSPFGRIREWWAEIISVDQFDLAWDSLVSAGKIAEFRNRDCLWVIKKFKHEQFKDLNSKQRQGVENFLNDYPEIIEPFMELYPMAFNTPSIPHPKDIDTPLEGDVKGNDASDTDTDTDTEKKTTTTPPPEKPEPKPIAEQFLTLADQCQAVINRAQQTYGIAKLPTYDRQKAAVVIRQTVQIDKIPADELVLLVDFGMLDDFWRDKLLSIAHWRVASKRNGLPKIVNVYNRWKRPDDTFQSRNGNGHREVVDEGERIEYAS